MKKLLVLFFSCLVLTAFAQPGYEIKVTFKPFKNQYIYLGHYFGKQYPIIDSVMLNDKGEGVFRGKEKLQGGIYLVGYPNKAGFFEILVDQQQHFSILADTATLAQGVKFINSPDNELFIVYQKAMSSRGAAITEMQKKYDAARQTPDSAKFAAELKKLDDELDEYREKLIKDHPTSLLASLLVAMREPVLPASMKDPKNKQDSIASYRFVKDHFWDGVHFYDGRLAYTPFFEAKLDKYFTQLVIPNPDSVIKEMDWMLAYTVASPEMRRFLLIKFVNRYLMQKYMWEDAIFVHLFEKYFSNSEYSWLSEKGKKTITDRAYSLMANIMGTPAAEIDLPDTSGKKLSLYSIKANYILVCFWDPTCGHCKEIMPRIDSVYRAKWKAMGMNIYAVAKETDATQKAWLNFISDHKLQDWNHVYYSKAEEKKRVESGTPGYSQLYDVMSFPTLYLLDKDKRIIAKKLSFAQIDEILTLKSKK
jgi:thiol-disulfide isomerase/thioredoxin